MTRIAIPAATALVVVAAFVGVSGWNRSAEPRPAIRVTERELALAGSPAATDRVGLQLTVQFEARSDPLDARNWLPEARLRSLGFPMNVPAGDPRASEVFGNMPPRVGWVVFEYDGDAWREIARRRELQRLGASAPRAPSRLVPVDAGLDPEALSARYGAGHLILRAVIGVTFVDAASGGPLVYGWVRQIVPSSVAVPRHLVPVLNGLEPIPRIDRTSPPGVEPAPRYEVDLGVGRLGIPFVKGIRRLD